MLIPYLGRFDGRVLRETVRAMAPRAFSLSQVKRWAVELVLIFIGVYAAFWLNSYEGRQRDAKRRDQILASLEQQLKDGVESARQEGAREDAVVREFRRSLDSGEMPPLKPFTFTSDYNATDMAALLQSGGIELL